MGWFSKNEKKEEVPSLPRLPKLPEFPLTREETEYTPPTNFVNQLPSFPNSLSGQKFSQNTIKNAVTGSKEVEEDFEANDFVKEEGTQMRMMPKIPQFNFIRESSSPIIERKVVEASEGFEEARSRIKKTEPIFIRIDKFEESLNIFEDIRRQVIEIEKILGDIKKVKEKEERELEQWERELSSIKGQIEKIDRNVFSRIE